MKTGRAIRLAVRAVLTEQERRFNTCFCSAARIGKESAQAEKQPQVMPRFHTASGTEDAGLFPEDALKSQTQSMLFCRQQRRILPQGSLRALHPRPSAIEGNPRLPLHLSGYAPRSISHPVRQPIALTGNALPDCTHNPRVADAQPTLVQQQPATETGGSCNDVPDVSGRTPTLQRTAELFQKSFDFSRKHASQAENPEKAQGKTVGQSEGTCEPVLAAAPTLNRNEAIITTPQATTPCSITQHGANHQRLSAATKDEPDLDQWEQFFSSFEAAAARWQALPKCRWAEVLRIHCDGSAMEILESSLAHLEVKG
ncbi:hypothetical protein Efla_001293 [Eimeria flavescens]